FMTDRAAREQLFKDSWTRTERTGENDTRPTIARIAQIRAQKAKLLGFPNYAAWNLQDQMAQTPEAVDKFFAKLVPASVARAKKKGGFKLQPYDWDFYSEQVRKQKYNLDENEIKPYFELNNVLQNGVFY